MRPLLPLLLLAACAAPTPDDAFTRFEVTLAADAAEVDERFVEVIDRAESTLDVALPALASTALADAIIDRWDQGVDVRVVTDYDQREDAGAQALFAAGVPVALADDGISYFDFNIGADVAWTSDQTMMSHAWVLIDEREALLATEAGTARAGVRVITRLTGEDLLIDLATEHNQVFGGADAVSTTAYDNLAKSIADFRSTYTTQTDQVLEVWFGPQERLTKRVIDAVYGARASVRVLTDDFANDGLSLALQDKAAYGFEVEVVVGPRFEQSAYFLSQQLRAGTPDVPKRRLCGDAEVPTVVLVDYEPARNGRRYPARAFILSHDLYSAARLFRQDEVVNDQLIDGNLLVFNDYDEPTGVMQTLGQVYDDHAALASGGLDCP